MIKNGIFLISCLIGFNCWSQEAKLKGKIITPNVESSAINIVNLSQELGTTNNSRGEFEIPAALGDTLYFSSVQYEPREIVITKEVLKMPFLTVLLVEQMNELEEVSISNIDLSGNLATDSKSIPTLTQADLGFPMRDIPRLSSIERKLKTASNLSTSSPDTPPGMKVSLDGILNHINGRTSMLLKATAMERLSKIVDVGEAAMPVSFFTELAIPENRIRDFIYFCAEAPHFAGLLPEAKRLELIAFYQAKAPQFLKERL